MKKDWCGKEFRSLVTLGESITAGGWSTSPERCWAALLAGLINEYQSRPVKLYNSGIGANVISVKSPCYPYSGKPAAGERLEKHVIGPKPDLLVVSYGLNDARGGTPVELFKKELTALIRKVRRRINPLLILTGPSLIKNFTLGGERWSHAGPALLRRFNRTIAGVAEKERCLFADILSAMDNAEWLVHYDGVHVNDLGHRIIADRIFEVLAQNCSCLAEKTKKLERKSPAWRDESSLQKDYGY